MSRRVAVSGVTRVTITTKPERRETARPTPGDEQTQAVRLACEQGFSAKMTQVVPTPASTPSALCFTLWELDRGLNKTNVLFALTFPSPHFTKADVTVNVMVYLHEIIDPRSE